MIEKSKICFNCEKEKPLGDFYKHKGMKDGYVNKCKICQNNDMKSWREKNKTYNKEYYNENLKYFKNHSKKYYKENSEKLKAYSRKFAKENPEYRINYRRERYKNDEDYRIRVLHRRRIHELIENEYLSCSSKELLGCSIKEFKRHIEDKFDGKMNWNNQGYNGWHIDHILPCSKFDLTKKLHQKVCFHYTNMQPLWAKDNYSKKGSLPSDIKTIDEKFINKYIEDHNICQKN